MSAPQEPKAVIVLGVHRSGTSAIAGALALLGFHPGANLLPAVSGVNDNGFFEDQRVVALNDEILGLFDQDWRWPLSLPTGWQSLPELTPLRKRARAMLVEQNGHPLWLLKDPRMCQTLPLWLTELEALGVSPHLLLVVRDAKEVVASLNKRDELGAPLAESLWLNHLLAAEFASRKHPRTLIRYNDVIQNSSKQLKRIINWLGETPEPAALASAAEFVSPKQRNNKATQLPDLQLPLAEELNHWFTGLNANTVDSILDDVQSQQFFENVVARQQQALNQFQGVIETQAAKLLDWEQSFAEAIGQLETQKNAVSAYADNAAQSADAARQQYEALQTATTAISKHADELTSLKEQVLALEGELATVTNDAELFRARAQRVLGDQVLPPAQSQRREQTTNDYKGLINLRVENNAHTRAVRYLGEHFGESEPLKILDIGCSEGYFGATLKDNGHTVWGIETNAIAADIAQEALDQVYRDSIEAFLLEEKFLAERFDAIVLGDVLEHLLDPRRVLQAISARLTERGVIISSVPNVAHERVRMMLLEGRWDYSATGIMDNTHLHFFTRDTLVELHSNAGLSVERMSTIELPGENVQIPVNPAIEVELKKYIADREREVFQFVTLAKPAASPEIATEKNVAFTQRAKHNVLCLPPAPDSSLYSIRIGDPLKRYTELFGGEVKVGPFGAPSDDDVHWADTIVLQREVTDEQLQLVDHLQAAGKRVVFDIDDYLLEPPEYLSVYDHCIAMRPKLEEMLRKVDAVSASTMPLVEKLRPYNSKVFHTPNYAWTSNPPVTQNNPDNADLPVRILVASSDSVRVDFLVPALQQIQRDFDVELVGIGPPGDYLRSVGLAIDTLPLLSHEEFKAYAASRDNTIALIPLDSNDFNACKSAVKYFDYALAGVPCICSGYEPYISAVEQSVTGALCPNITQWWVQAVSAYLESPLLRQEYAEAARTSVLTAHNLNITAAAWHFLFDNTRFLEGDPVERENAPPNDQNLAPSPQRSPAELVRGTLRHIVKPASWASVWQIYKNEGLAGVRKKWKLVF